MASWDDLSEDLIFKFLVWLPVISLLRCRLVCKSWKSIISNPDFIQAHLNNSEKRQPSSVLRVAYSEELYLCTRDEDSVKLNFPSNLSGMHRHIRSVNGLVTLADINCAVIYLWNPLTRLFKLLPQPRITFRAGFKINIGFGYDFVSRAYKILRVVYREIRWHDNSLHSLLLAAELYSTNDNSWKWIPLPETIIGFELSLFSKCINTKSRIYFDGIDGILSFDLHSEVLGLYAYPKSEEHLIMSNIFDYNGSLAMILKCGSIISLWMLDDVEDKFYWIKKFNLEPDLMYDSVRLYLGGGQFIVEDTVGYYFYDNRKEGSQRFSLFAPDGDCASVVQFTESLVSLEGFE